MKIVIVSAVMVAGTAVFPTQKIGTGKTAKEVPTVIDVDKKIAKELLGSKQAKPAPTNAKVNFEVKPLEREESDGLDDFFGEDGEGTEPEDE